MRINIFGQKIWFKELFAVFIQVTDVNKKTDTIKRKGFENIHVLNFWLWLYMHNSFYF